MLADFSQFLLCCTTKNYFGQFWIIFDHILSNLTIFLNLDHLGTLKNYLQDHIGHFFDVFDHFRPSLTIRINFLLLYYSFFSNFGHFELKTCENMLFGKKYFFCQHKFFVVKIFGNNFLR